MKIIEITNPTIEYTHNGVTKVYTVENFLRFEEENLFEEKEKEGFNVCLFLDKFDITSARLNPLPDENGNYRNEVMWRASFIK